MNGNQPKSEIILYQTEDGVTRVEVRLQDDTVWLTLAQMADLFQRDKSGIFKHVQNIFEEGELSAGGTVANFAIVQLEGGREVAREIDHYNLHVIISVGYRPIPTVTNSRLATRNHRQVDTIVLKDSHDSNA